MLFQSKFIAFTVLAASLVIADDTLDESKSIQKIELLGGKVTKDDTLPGRPVIDVDFQGSKRFNDKYMYLLKPLTTLKSLNLMSTAITDEGLAEIRELKNLTTLNLSSTSITDVLEQQIFHPYLACVFAGQCFWPILTD